MENMNKTRRAPIRNWFQAAFFALTNGYASGFMKGKIYTGPTKAVCFPGLNCYSCPGALYACPIGALQAVMSHPGYKVSLYVFGILALFGSLFGRLICGWMCPFGLVQDLLYKIPLFKKIKNLPGHKYINWLRFIVLAVFVLILPATIVNISGLGSPWYCEYICPSGTLIAGIPLVSMNQGLREAAGMLFKWKLAILILVVLVSVKCYRPFCKYVCPLGALYGFFNPISLYRFTIDKDKCVNCGACSRACNMGIDVVKTPNSMQCIRCGDCKRTCPKGAITSTFDKVYAACVREEENAGDGVGVAPVAQNFTAPAAAQNLGSGASTAPATAAAHAFTSADGKLLAAYIFAAASAFASIMDWELLNKSTHLYGSLLMLYSYMDFVTEGMLALNSTTILLLIWAGLLAASNLLLLAIAIWQLFAWRRHRISREMSMQQVLIAGGMWLSGMVLMGISLMGEWANTFSTYYATQLIVPIALGVLALLLRAPQAAEVEAAEVETAGLGARLDETEGQGAAQTVTAQPGPAQAAQIPAEDTSTVRSSFDPRSLIPCGALLAAVCLIAVGISRGEMQVVLAKAINICMQCIGIG